MPGTSSITDYFHGIGTSPKFNSPVKNEEGETTYFHLQDHHFEEGFLLSVLLFQEKQVFATLVNINIHLEIKMCFLLIQ